MTPSNLPDTPGRLPGGPRPPTGPDPLSGHDTLATRNTAAAGKHRVLLVDDDRDTLTSLKHYVEAHLPNTEVLTSRSPLDALDVVDQTDVRVVITDFKMPGMDGIEFWRRAREHRDDLVGMLITANIDIDLQLTAQREGLSACLAKPFDMRRLRTTLSNMMDAADRRGAP